ncbi:hypothetical protein ES332_D11G297100v1 [Gossypium tomentosum]|nr:hypothetical protein ES332_D11G297100v1 [Gossypium tomentosum]
MHRHVFKLCGDQDTLRIRHWNEEFEYHRKQPLAKLEFAD